MIQKRISHRQPFQIVHQNFLISSKMAELTEALQDVADRNFQALTNIFTCISSVHIISSNRPTAGGYLIACRHDLCHTETSIQKL